MTLPRFLVAVELSEGSLVELPAEEVRHARSRRLRDGERAIVLDGRGTSAEGRLVDGGTGVLLERLRPGLGEPPALVTILLAAAEPARVEWAVEKGTECGAGSFVLVLAGRSQKSHARLLGSRTARLRRIAAEAAKQCGRSRVPSVEGPVALGYALSQAPRPLFLADPEGVEACAPLPPGRASLAIGPEGGFEEGERELLRAEGARLVTLGPRILRLETAVACALARLVDPR